LVVKKPETSKEKPGFIRQPWAGCDWPRRSHEIIKDIAIRIGEVVKYFDKRYIASLSGNCCLQDVRCIPQDVRCIPQLVRCVPQLVRCVPQLVRCIPELVRYVPELVRYVPELVRCVPELVRYVPQSVRWVNFTSMTVDGSKISVFLPSF
jgi:hypothetical protein